ncbi:molybdate ABC transporter substrate-binding protein [Pirellulaceae bacterium SH467]|jgi:molybdate transport system substrate-binding protein
MKKRIAAEWHGSFLHNELSSRMAKVFIALGLSIVVAVGIVISLVRSSPPLAYSRVGEDSARASEEEVQLYVASSNRAVLEEICQLYEAKTGNRVVIHFGASQTLLAQLEIAKSGGLFLPADDSYLHMAMEKGLVDQVFPIATMRIGLAVRKGNPKGITGWSSILQPKIRLVQANPDAAAVGQQTRQNLQRANLWRDLELATLAFRSNVNEVANDIRLGVADVGIVYDAMLSTYPDLEFLELAELAGATNQVSVGVIHGPPSREAAIRFARFITSPDDGIKVYQKYGFDTIDPNRAPERAWRNAPESQP